MTTDMNQPQDDTPLTDTKVFTHKWICDPAENVFSRPEDEWVSATVARNLERFLREAQEEVGHGIERLAACRTAADFGGESDPMAADGWDALGSPENVPEFVAAQFKRIKDRAEKAEQQLAQSNLERDHHLEYAQETTAKLRVIEQQLADLQADTARWLESEPNRALRLEHEGRVKAERQVNDAIAAKCVAEQQLAEAQKERDGWKELADQRMADYNRMVELRNNAKVELATLREQLAEANELYSDNRKTIDRVCRERDSARTENAALAADARRYRPWGHIYAYDGYFGTHYQLDSGEWNGQRPQKSIQVFVLDDAAIDTALEQK